MTGASFVRVSIWLSLGAWGLAEWWRLRAPRGSPDPPSARAAWTLGGGLALLHVLAGFDVHHGWSHAAAVAETARRTEEALGRPFGAGVYLNYAFVAAWIADAAWWWLSPASFGTRPRTLASLVRLFLLFMFVNGAIVFARGPVRIAGLGVVTVLAAAWYRRREAFPSTTGP